MLFDNASFDSDGLSKPKDINTDIKKPLAIRMRPKNLEEISGQSHILGNDCLLPNLIRADSFGSIILYGPPGCGKTTLAEVIANETKSNFIRINAVSSNVAELRDVLRIARSRPESRTILFIDELHRFNKSQQDLLLPDVEQGVIRLIGATTHNPGFYVNAPLLSRSHLFRLEPLAENEIIKILDKALSDTEVGLGDQNCHASDNILKSIAVLADGDVRRALNALETIVIGKSENSEITDIDLQTYAKERQIRYDKNEDEHYDTISAFIKSIRGCDPDAALYWLAKMIAGGEDARFIARRLVIFASEDIGLADSQALPLAVATFQACDFIGYPECELNLAHATIYLATAPKSNSSYLALAKTKKYLKNNPLQSVPLHLRDSGGKASKQMGNSKEYLYSHNFPESISGQTYMERPQKFYEPKEVGCENAIAAQLKKWETIKVKLS